MTKKSPLFISGVYRSGTTLPVKILNAHPDICLTHDTVNFFRYYLKYAATIQDDYGFVINDCAERLEKRFNINVPASTILSKLKDEHSISLKIVYEVLMRETFCAGKSNVIWGEKSLMQWSNIPLFLQMFEDSKAIMIIRDPRSVLASFRDFTIEKGERYLDAIFATLNALQWSATIGKTLSSDRFRIVYFEKLVEDPDAWAREMCDFLGLEYYNEMTNSKKFKDHEGNPWSANTSYRNVNNFSREPIDRWRSKLTDLELCFAESILGDAMKLHNYELSDVKVDSTTLKKLLITIGQTGLLEHRLAHWVETGNGVEGHPSDATSPMNWSKTMHPKDNLKV
ncbi:MAG: sulfotransferase [Bacteroidia bacterium]